MNLSPMNGPRMKKFCWPIRVWPTGMSYVTELRSSELAVRRYDTKYLQQALVRLVPELAKSGFNTEPAKVIPIYKSK